MGTNESANRVEYVRHMVGNGGEAVDPRVIRGLIRCLAPHEVVECFDCSFEQPAERRRLLLQQVAEDAQAEPLPCHEALADELLEGFETLHYRKKQGCASALDCLYDVVSPEARQRILTALLRSHYKRIRRLGFRRARQCDDPSLREYIWQAWEANADEESARMVMHLASPEEIVARFDELERAVSGTWLLNRLYARMAESDPRFLTILQSRDGISFAYACVKAGASVPESLARELYQRYREDNRIGLLVWCFGKLKLWNVLVEIAGEPLLGPYASQFASPQELPRRHEGGR